MHDWSRLPESCRYQAWGPNTEEDTRAFVQRAVEGWQQQPSNPRTYVAYVDDEVLGLGTLKLASAPIHRQGELAYAVHPKVWGRGLGTQIGQAVLAIGFGDLRLHRIAGTCDPRNAASAAVLRKLGMTYEGRLRQVQLIRDGWRDSEVYSLLAEEWRNRS